MLNEEEQEAFTRLWTEAQPIVADYVRSVIRERSAARDILQSTALALLRKFPEYDRTQPFLPWSLGFAKFQVLGFKRDAARSRITFDSELLDRYTQNWAEMAPGISDEEHHLRNCLRQLTGRPREAVRLRYFEDLSSPEIADRMNLRPGNVRVLLRRTREKLRHCVEQQLQAEGRPA